MMNLTTSLQVRAEAERERRRRLNLRAEEHAAFLDEWLHEGQRRARQSQKRFVAVLAGTQGGKTSFGPEWLWDEIQRCGPGDYLAVTASYDLLKLKMLPALLDTFQHQLGIGHYLAADRVIEITRPKARVILRSAESGGGLESSTAKAAWLDEAGQDSFTLQSWEAVLRRLSIHQGRALLTTTLYNLGWLKSAIFDPWRASSGKHPDIDVIQFDSTENPAFPAEEFERARQTMPLWKFNMFYRGLYERPAGLIYDCFDENRHVCKPFAVPADWPRYLGLDFGGINTAGLFYANEPGTPRYYLYREYKAGGRTAAAHAEALLEGEPMRPHAVGGSHSEEQWREEFRRAGLPIWEPSVKDVEVGIGRVYGAHKQDRIMVFNTCTGYLDQKRAYSRKLDAMGEATEEIEGKSTYHFMDAERYIVGYLERGESQGVWL